MDQFIGEIRLFAGNFAPKGWAFCEGQLIPISQNSAQKWLSTPVWYYPLFAFGFLQTKRTMMALIVWTTLFLLKSRQSRTHRQ